MDTIGPINSDSQIIEANDEVLKVSPSQIIFGSSIDHDVHLITHPKYNSTEFQYSSKIQHMLEMQQKFLDIARQIHYKTTD